MDINKPLNDGTQDGPSSRIGHSFSSQKPDASSLQIKNISALPIPDSSSSRIGNSSGPPILDSLSLQTGKNSVSPIPDSSPSRIGNSSTPPIIDSLSIQTEKNSVSLIPDSSSLRIGNSSTLPILDTSTLQIEKSSASPIPDSSPSRIGNSSSSPNSDTLSSRIGSSSTPPIPDSSPSRIGNSSSPPIIDSSSLKMEKSSASRIPDSLPSRIGNSSSSPNPDTLSSRIGNSSTPSILDTSSQQIKKSSTPAIPDSSPSRIGNSSTPPILDTSSQQMKKSSTPAIPDSSPSRIGKSSTSPIRDSLSSSSRKGIFISSSVKGESSKDTRELKKKMKKVDVPTKTPSSPASLLVRSTAMLPSSVIQIPEVKGLRPGSEAGLRTTSGSATGNPRNKTALAPGHSLMDWIRLGASGADLTGVGGVPRLVSLKELANHNKQNDAWIAIRGVVYNVTKYMDFHPGGVPELMRGVGKDSTKLFDSVHAWVNYQSILQKCIVGRLSLIANDSPAPTVKKKPAVSLPTSPSFSASLGHFPPSAPNPKMEWSQTSDILTLCYFPVKDHPTSSCEIKKLGDSKIRLRLCFENDVFINELNFAGDVDWPPKWRRDFETMKIEFTFSKKKRAVWKTLGKYEKFHEARSEQRTYREYKVVSNIALCKTVYHMVLRAEDYFEVVPIGRHVEAKMNVMGMEVSRMYTPVPPFLHPEEVAPNHDSDCLSLMVKRYHDGALSPSLTALTPGQSVTLSNALGTFVSESFADYSTINLLAAGTGLTAMLSIIQWSLGRRNVTALNLINFNRDEDNIFYTEQLDKVACDGRMKVTNVLSQPGESWTGLRGVVSAELLKDLISQSLPHACVFSCGPTIFLQSAQKSLRELGWKTSQLFEFDD